MHTGSRAFCLLMALAATGAECVSAATSAQPVDAGHYRVEATSAGETAKQSATTLPMAFVANHVLAVAAVSHAISLPSAQKPDTCRNFKLSVDDLALQSSDANSRVLASIADANERQLLFVKITRG